MIQNARRTILIADDDHFVRRIAARILEKSGFMVLEARDGKEALDIICHHQGMIHLLFTDMLMPALDGRQLSDISQSLRPGLKVLYTSAYTDRMIVAQGVLASKRPFIEKSYTPAQLINKVEEVIGVGAEIALARTAS